MFYFLYDDGFLRCLKKLPRNIQEQIKEKLRFLVAQENPLFYAKKLKGLEGIYRFRTGDYRVIFELQKDTITLLLVRHRRDVYR